MFCLSALNKATNPKKNSKSFEFTHFKYGQLKKTYKATFTKRKLFRFFLTVSTVTNSTELATTIKSHVTSTTNQHSSEKDFMYYVPPSIILMVVLTGLSFYYWLRRKRRRLGEQMLLSDYNGASVTSQASPYPALMLDVIHQGKLSVIWRGTYCQRAVAIKTISKDYADLWKTEKDLFVEHKLKHENLISFVSAERRFHENCIQYWIVTEYHENGSLAEYITKNVLSRELLLKMVYNITCGLVYLHTSHEATGKQIVAHRDLKTGNVLVKKDLSCCISDLGLAIALPERISVSRDLCQVRLLANRSLKKLSINTFILFTNSTKKNYIPIL